MAVLVITSVIAIFIWRPSKPALWAGTALTVLGVGAWMSAIAFARLRNRRLIGSRSALSEDEIYRNYYANAGLQQAAVLEMWAEVARTFSMPIGKLRPGDRFGHELGGYWITDDQIDVLSWTARERSRKSGIELNLSEIKTLDDYVRGFARLGKSS